MGNARSSANVVLPDGTIHQYYDDKSMTVAELMLEYPQQVVVEFNPSAIDKRTSGGGGGRGGGGGGGPLPADNKLEMNKVYLMLPIKRGKPAALSSKEARRLLMTANSIFKSKQASVISYTGFIPMFAKMCTVRNHHQFSPVVVKKRGVIRREKKEDVLYVEKGSSTEVEEDGGGFGDLSSELMKKQISGGKKWRPSLDTINEKNGGNKQLKLINIQLDFVC